MIETVEDATHELYVAIKETVEDLGEDAPDEGSIAMDLFMSMALDWPPHVAREVARREFGYMPRVVSLDDVPDPLDS